MSIKVLALAGGVGGAKLALGLSRILPPGLLTVVVNTGDDDVFHGLHVSPDLDTVVYTLAGLANPETGWGLNNETFRVLESLESLGVPTWFQLGDKDLAIHIRRTELLQQGYSLSSVTREICEQLGVEHSVVPMSDDPLKTIAVTDKGNLPFQEYFVHRQCEPKITGVRFDGMEYVKIAPGFNQALAASDCIIFCPSNPVVSLGPILAIPGVQNAITAFKGPKIAISPIIDGQAIKGPAAKMLLELGEEVSCVGVARRLRSLCNGFVIDDADATQANRINELGMKVLVTPTLMTTDEQKTRLAKQVLDFARDIVT